MTFEKDHENYNCTITLDTGEQRRVFASWIHNNNLDQWKGWHCSAGSQNFYIDKNFDVYSGECKNDYLGNMFTDWQVKNDTICHRETCSPNVDGLLATKYQPE